MGDDLATQSILWTPDFLGNGQGDVVTGPFANWQMPYLFNGRMVIFRNLTVAPLNAQTEPSLMSHKAMASILDAGSFRDITWYVNSEFESHHGALHNWVGGVMANLPISPSDPVFFLHHAFIDCLWEQSRINQAQSRPTLDVRYDYPNDSAALGVGVVQPDGEILRRPQDSHHYSLNIMHPFGPMRNIDGLKTDYFDMFYYCEPSPVCSKDNPDCGSVYMFCDLNSEKCAPKLQLRASCEQFKDFDPCHHGVCCHGICQSTCEAEGSISIINQAGGSAAQGPSHTQHPFGNQHNNGRTLLEREFRGGASEDSGQSMARGNPNRLSQNQRRFEDATLQTMQTIPEAQKPLDGQRIPERQPAERHELDGAFTADAKQRQPDLFRNNLLNAATHLDTNPYRNTEMSAEDGFPKLTGHHLHGLRNSGRPVFMEQSQREWSFRPNRPLQLSNAPQPEFHDGVNPRFQEGAPHLNQMNKQVNVHSMEYNRDKAKIIVG